jgi:hypothetical protein
MLINTKIFYTTIMLFLLLPFESIFPNNRGYDNRVFNLKGWNVPDTSKMEKISNETKRLLNHLPEIEIENYQANPLDKNNIHHYKILNKKVTEKSVDLREELDTYQEEWVKKLKVFKEKDTQKILCYQYDCLRGDVASEIFIHYLRTIKADRSYHIGGMAGGWVSEYIADLDDDGIFESRFNAFDNEAALHAIIEKKFQRKASLTKREKEINNLKKAWKEYLDYPSGINAQKMFSSIPNDYQLGENKDEKALWEWIWLTLPVLEKNVYAGDRYAIKIAMRFFPLFKKTNLSNLDNILATLAQVNPVLFLEELQSQKKWLTPIQAIDGSVGYEFIGLAQTRYLELQKTLRALNKVKKETLLQIRDQCITYLEIQIKYLQKEFDVKK